MDELRYPSYENLRGSRAYVLDCGFVELVDYMGDDCRVVQTARVSTGNGLRSPAEDLKLLRYLVFHRHTSPFESVKFTFLVKLPIFVARQIIRHRTANVNEISGRYVAFENAEFFTPECMRSQGRTNRQGSGGDIDDPDLVDEVAQAAQHSFEAYERLLERGVSREMARIVLPLSLYTQWFWTMDLHNLLHFLELRLDAHAQLETRQYAEAILSLITPIVPWSVEAFKDFRLNAASIPSHWIGRILAYVDGQADAFAFVDSLPGGERAKFKSLVNRMLVESGQEAMP